MKNIFLAFVLIVLFFTAHSVFADGGSWIAVTGVCYKGQHVDNCTNSCTNHAASRNPPWDYKLVVDYDYSGNAEKYNNVCWVSPTCPAGQEKINYDSSNPNSFVCTPQCGEGQHINLSGSPLSAECVDDDTSQTPDDDCPSGYYQQGEINGQAICQLQCPDGGVPGVINGESGCYGAGETPSCPSGQTWGYVNMMGGCYPGGSGSSSSTGGGASSTGGGSSAGSGGGSSAGSGGDGGNGSGGGYGDNAPSYGEGENCPAGYSKNNSSQCVSDGAGDCPVGYKSVVISKSPFYAMCMSEPNNSSSSSVVSSSQSSSSSSQNNSSGTGGGGSSSGGGSGGGGSVDEGAGQCDPTAKNYLECITPSGGDYAEHTSTDSGATTFEQVNSNFLNRLNAAPVLNGFANVGNAIQFADKQCPQFSIDLSDTIIGRSLSTNIHCDLMEIISPYLSIVSMIGWAFVGFRIFASA